MINLTPKLSVQVMGLVASGQVIVSDYESGLIPAVEAKLNQHRKVRILYRVGPTFTGFSVGAMWDDAKVGITYLNVWEKIAIVTDVEWIRSASSIFDFALRCPFKVFPDEQYKEAEKWIAAYTDHDLVIVEQIMISLHQINIHA